MVASAYDLLLDGELAVVRWHLASAAAADELHRRLLAHAESQDEPLFLAILIGADVPPPDASAREALLRGYHRVEGSCRDVRLSLLGGGVGHALLRGVVNAMVLATGLRGRSFRVDRNVGELLAAAAAALGRDLAAVRRVVIEAGLLTAAELDG